MSVLSITGILLLAAIALRVSATKNSYFFVETELSSDGYNPFNPFSSDKKRDESNYYPGWITNMEVINQKSKVYKCKEKDSYWYEQRDQDFRLWVQKGCRADFKITYEKKEDGGWSNWIWDGGACDSDCERLYKRTCSNPEPSRGGRTCSGRDSEYRKCYGGSCVVGLIGQCETDSNCRGSTSRCGKYLCFSGFKYFDCCYDDKWEEKSLDTCSKSCNGGRIKMRRMCKTARCSKPNEEFTKSCNTMRCPSWGEWKLPKYCPNECKREFKNFKRFRVVRECENLAGCTNCPACKPNSKGEGSEKQMLCKDHKQCKDKWKKEEEEEEEEKKKKKKEEEERKKKEEEERKKTQEEDEGKKKNSLGIDWDSLKDNTNRINGANGAPPSQYELDINKGIDSKINIQTKKRARAQTGSVTSSGMKYGLPIGGAVVGLLVLISFIVGAYKRCNRSSSGKKPADKYRTPQHPPQQHLDSAGHPPSIGGPAVIMSNDNVVYQTQPVMHAPPPSYDNPAVSDGAHGFNG